MYAFTQMTTEVVSDEEYLLAAYQKMRVRGALIGVESFSEEGLRSAHKQWNPTGQRMVETIQQIQDAGILVLSSIICGLETDTLRTLETMRTFALESGSVLAQFTFYHPYPGTKDFYDMLADIKKLGEPGFVPKRRLRLREERFWLKSISEGDVIDHPHLRRDELSKENQKCWDAFYSIKEVIRRTRHGRPGRWPLKAKLVYLLLCLAFKRIYCGQGMAADGVKRKQLGTITKSIIKIGVATYNYFYRTELKGSLRHP